MGGRPGHGDRRDLFLPLYLPGAMILFRGISSFFLHSMKRRELGPAIKESGRILMGAGFVLFFTVPMVRVYINSGVNGLGYPGCARDGGMGGTEVGKSGRFLRL